MFPCQRQQCAMRFERAEQRDRHQRSCNASMATPATGRGYTTPHSDQQLPLRPSQFASAQNQAVLLQPLRAGDDSYSGMYMVQSPNSYSTDSDSSTPAYTPASSRRTSVNALTSQARRGSQNSRRRSASDDTIAYCEICQASECTNDDHVKINAKDAKKYKERKSRKSQQHRAQDMEDLPNLYLGFRGGSDPERRKCQLCRSSSQQDREPRQRRRPVEPLSGRRLLCSAQGRSCGRVASKAAPGY